MHPPCALFRFFDPPHLNTHMHIHTHPHVQVLAPGKRRGGLDALLPGLRRAALPPTARLRVGGEPAQPAVRQHHHRRARQPGEVTLCSSEAFTTPHGSVCPPYSTNAHSMTHHVTTLLTHTHKHKQTTTDAVPDLPPLRSATGGRCASSTSGVAALCGMGRQHLQQQGAAEEIIWPVILAFDPVKPGAAGAAAAGAAPALSAGRLRGPSGGRADVTQEAR